ncbi:hypothetical protein B0H16DRAFT_1901041 [Mycena metata]|uniref:Uncharacterized protein n=1 Tax=Mycena metata TaxID=1033252 RepID=A0AAD7MBJ1_9AGAR|nr:hypothetical protein B0H16DRAFT_1901041 [Mycena metata]
MLPSKSSKFELEHDSSPNFGTNDPAPAEFSNSPPQPSASIYTARAGAWAPPLHFFPHHSPPSLSLAPTIWSYVGHDHVASLLWYLVKGYPFETRYTKDYIKAISKAGPIMQVAFRDLPSDSYPKRFRALWNRYSDLLDFLGEVPKSFGFLRLAEYTGGTTITENFQLPPAPPPVFPENFDFSHRLPVTDLRTFARPSKSKPKAVEDTPKAKDPSRPKETPSKSTPSPSKKPESSSNALKRKQPPSPAESESASESEPAPKSTRGKKAKLEKEDAKGKGKSKASKDEAEYVNQSEASASEAEEVEVEFERKRRFLDPPVEYDENRPEIYRELKEPKLKSLSKIDVNKAAVAFKEALEAKMAAHKDTGDQAFHFNLDHGEDSPYITIVRKENSYINEYHSQLAPESLMFPNPGQSYLPTQAPFPKIPLEEVTELEWPDTVIPTFGCNLCQVLNVQCIPTGFGGPCASCTRYRFRRCDHRKSIEALTSMFAEMSVLYTAASDVTGSVISQAAASFARASRAREAYDIAQQEAHVWLRHLIKHVMHCIATVGLSAFQERFVREESDPLVSDAFQAIIDRYNAHVEAHGSPDALRLPLADPEDPAKSDSLIPLFARGDILQEISKFTETALRGDDPMDEDGDAPADPK